MSTVRKRIRISEWQSSEPLDLHDADVRSLLTMPSCLSLRPCASGLWQVCAKSFVGRVRLPTVDLEIRPKTPIKNVLRLIAYAQRVPELLQGVDDSSDGCLEDLVVAAFVETVERLIHRGLRRDYVEREGELRTLRGRIDVTRQLRRPFEVSPTLDCRYQEHTLDTAFNRALRFTASRAWSEWPSLQNRIVALRSRLQDVPLRSVRPEDLDRFVYDRLDEYYEPAHRLCRLVLEGARVALDHGEAAPAGSFLIDMNRVFEAFLGRWLEENVRAPFRVELQPPHRLDLEQRITVRPDVVIYRADVVVGVLDAKYKVVRQPANEDVYQALAYARRFGVRTAWLVFPTDGQPPSGPITMKDGHNVVRSVGLGIEQEWDQLQKDLQRVRDELCFRRLSA